MSEGRAFRFGVNPIGSASKENWKQTAIRAEELGYSTLSIADHLWSGLAPLTSLMSAAEATSRLRIGSLVFANDFRHPVMLAREAATIDVLSEGRLELGLGTGWERDDYESMGIPLDPPGVRVSRYEEAARLILRLFCEEEVTFSGNHYQVNNLKLRPRPMQSPHPPLLMGGAGHRMLSLAARTADIVSVNILTTAAGDTDWASAAPNATGERIAWVQQCAGQRFDQLEFNVLVLAVIVTADRRGAAEAFAKDWNVDLSKISLDDMLDSPYFLFGTEDEMEKALLLRRERYGISYFTLFGEDSMEAFAPVIERLRGK